MDKREEQITSKIPSTMQKNLSPMILSILLIGALYASDNSSVSRLRLGSPKTAVITNLADEYVLTPPPEGTNIWIATPKSGHDGIYKRHELAFDYNQRLLGVTSQGQEHLSIDTAMLATDLFNELYNAAKPPKIPNDLTDLKNTKFLDTRMSLHHFAIGTVHLQELEIPLGNEATLYVKIEQEKGKATTVQLEYQRAREQ